MTKNETCGYAWRRALRALRRCSPAWPTGDEREVVSEAISNPRCPSETIQQAARSSQELRRGAAAENPACPPQTLRALCADPDYSISETAARNPACPPPDAAATRRNQPPLAI